VKLQQDLREFIELLSSHACEYLVVGGHAVAYHGHPRFTGDIDFLLHASGRPKDLADVAKLTAVAAVKKPT
jgi:hypothetical protein